MDEEYDIIILGTGLKECILSGLLSVNKHKVLHMDRNDYYGAGSASLNLKQIYQHAGLKDEPDQKEMGSAKQYSIDLCPKFIMANGNMVKMLLSTKVTKYLDFKCVEGSYVYKSNKKGGGDVHEVPVTAKMALASPLMGMMQKRRFKNFLSWVMKIDFADKSTWDKCDLNKQTMEEIYKYWKCGDDIMNFTGHAIALYTDDAHRTDEKRTIDCLKRIQLYATSLEKYQMSPYIYPVWGLGGLPEGFSRLAAVHGSTYMLRRPITKINYDDDGKVESVTSTYMEDGKEVTGTAKLKKGGKLIGDPSYFEDTLKSGKPKVRCTGKIARWLIITTEAPESIKKKNPQSAQIIIPAKDCARANDIYISIMSNVLSVAPKGYYVCMISSEVFGKTEAEQKKELQIARNLLGKSQKEFFFVSDVYLPCNDPRKDSVFIPSTMDATTHFEQATREVMQLYRLITGKAVDLSANPEAISQEQ